NTLGDSATQLANMFKMQDELSERMGKLFTYAHMRNDQETTNDFYQALNQKAESLLTLLSSTMSVIVPEILSMDETTIDKVLKENEDLQQYKKVLNNIYRKRDHIDR